MRMTIGMILWVATANTALAHTVGGDVAALGHQLFGSHHLLFTAALIGLAVYLGRRWHRRNRV